MLKNITLSANQELIQLARKKAINQNSTLNAQFRAWLKQYVSKNSPMPKLGKDSPEMKCSPSFLGDSKTLYTEDLQHNQKIEDLIIVNPFLDL
jgi:hypothetical protein